MTIGLPRAGIVMAAVMPLYLFVCIMMLVFDYITS